jgi:O-antigen/teichoic acid export membrane protein
MLRFLKRKYTNLVSDTSFSEILTGSVWALSARVIAMAVGFAFSVLVARLYGAEVVGIVAIINSFLMLVTLFTVMGTPTSILRLIPEHMAKYSPSSAFRVYRKTQYIVIAVSIATGALSFFCADLIAEKMFSKPHLSFYFALASIFIVFQSLMTLNTQAVRGLRLIRLFALMQVLPQTFNLLFLIGVGILWPSDDVPIYAVLFGFTITSITGWAVMEYVFKKRMQPADKIQAIAGRTIVSMSLPMFMAGTMSFIIGNSGVIILGMFRAEAEVGYYSIAVKLATLTSFVLQAIDSMAGPKFSELFSLDKLDDLFHVAKKSAKLIFVITVPMLIGFLIFGKPILSIAFGKEFITAYPALVFIVVGEFVNSISGSTGMFMNMTGNQNTLSNIMIFAAILNIIINLWLIPIWGITGAAIAAMISLCLWNIASLVYIKKKFGKTTGYFPFFNINFFTFKTTK